MTKRITLFASILFLMVCGIAFPQQKKGVTILKVWDLPDPRKTDPFNRANLAVINAFRERYPDIELRSFSGLKIEGMAMDSQPLMAIAGGVAPDVLYVNFRQSDTYIKNGFLYPLDKFVDELPKKEIDLRVAKPVWPVIKRKGSDGSEHVWAFPYETLVRVLMYRKDLFQKVGLDPQRPPRNWDEFIDYAKRMTNPAEDQYGLKLSIGPQAAWDWITFLWSAGGDAVVQNEDGQWHAVFNSKEAVDAMEYYLKLTTQKWTDNNGVLYNGYCIRDVGRVVDKLWRDGKIGMRITYISERDLGGGLDPNLYGVAPIPLSWNGIRSSEINCRMLGIFSGAGEKNNAGIGERDPERVKYAAWQFIHFIDSEAARALRTKIMVESGYGRLQNPVYLKRYGYNDLLRYSRTNMVDIYKGALESGTPEPYGKNCQLIYQLMTYPIDKCIALANKDKLGSSRVEVRRNIKQILDVGVERTNKEMIGLISKDERMMRNRVALFVATFIAIAFFIVLRKVWLIFTPDSACTTPAWMRKKYFFVYLILFPALGSIVLWKYVPMLMGTIMSFQNYQIIGHSDWIGLQNFADILFDPAWWKALAKTLYYMFLMLAIGFIPPIALAILLQEVSHGKVVYRVIFYLPAVITGIIVIYLWKLLYDPSPSGGLNHLLMALGLPRQDWLKSETLAMICCVIPTVWAGMGPGCLIYLAALKGVPDDLYEAADLDGANFLQKVRYIVLPHLKALVIIQFIAAFIASSQQTGFILVMTFGGPNEATRVAGLMIFEKAYLGLKFGIATAMAWMLGSLLMGFTVLQLRKLSSMEFKTADSMK